MFFNRPNDRTDLQNLLGREVSDRQKLAKLEGDFAALRPKWNQLQDEAERLAAMYEANDRTYTREISETFWAERNPLLKTQLDAVILQRDALTAGKEQQITETKNRLHLRQSSLKNDFQSWLDQVSSMLPAALAAELAQARVAVQNSQDLPANVAMIERCVERVADFDSPSTIAPPLFNLLAAVKTALAIGPATE